MVLAGKFQISSTGQRLADLVRRGLKDASDASCAAIAHATLLALRDAAALLAALPPVVQQRELQVNERASPWETSFAESYRSLHLQM